jgi:hypothetical protein
MTDLIETACHNACQAMHAESRRAISNQRSPETCLTLAAALEALLHEGIGGDELAACAQHLRQSVAPWMVQP